MAEALKHVAGTLPAPVDQPHRFVTDTECPGLQIKITKAGRREWCWRVSSNAPRQTLGPLRTKTTPEGLTYTEAVALVATARAARESGGVASAVATIRRPTAGMTLREIAEAYLTSGRLNDYSATTTRSALRPILDGWIEPRGAKEITHRGIGDEPVDQITAPSLWSCITSLYLTGPRETWRVAMARRVLTHISTAVRHAQRSTVNLISAEITDVAATLLSEDDIKPRPIRGYARALDQDGLAKLRSAIREAVDTYTRNRSRGVGEKRHPLGYLLLDFCLLTGCRPGEAAKLRLTDIDGNVATLARHKTSRRGGVRKIQIGSEARRIMDEAAVWRRAERLDDTGLIFPGTGPQRSTTGIMRAPYLYAASIRAKTGLDIRAHSMRSILINALRAKKTDINVIAQMVGHADSRTTVRHYVQVTDTEIRDAVAATDSIFGLKS